MNQPRCILLAALALAALLVVPVTAQSTIDVSLNLRYDDPNLEAGGTFTLVAKVDDLNGIAALRALLNDIDITGLTWTTGIGAIDPVDPGGANERPAVMVLSSGVIDLLYGQSLAPPVLGVGTATSPGGLLATDPLCNGAWNNSTALITGTFAGIRPTFGVDGSLLTDGNVNDGAGGAVAAGTVTTTVRGDGVATDGLLKGDANRDWVVNGSDFALLGANWQQAGGWDQGDFNSDGMVDGSDFALLGANWQQSATPPSAAAAGVPEPAGIALLGICLVFAAMMRRRLG